MFSERPYDWGKLGSDIDGTLDLESQGSLVALSDDGKTLATMSGPAATRDLSDNLSLIKIYTWNGSAWTRKGLEIQSSYALGTPKIGSMCLSGNGTYVAISDYNVNPTETIGLGWGQVRVYRWSGSSWTTVGQSILYQNEENLYMSSVSINFAGNVIAIAAPETDATTLRSGLVRVYSFNGSTWIQKGQTISNNTPNATTGSGGVSLNSDGNVLAVGNPSGGCISVFQWNGSSWVKKGSDIQGKSVGDLFGGGVCLSADGNVVCAAAPPLGGDGYASVYYWGGSAWSQRGTDIAWGLDTLSMSRNGNVVAMGSIFMNGNGMARAYTWNGSSWRKMGKDFRGTFQSRTGQSVSVSGDGKVIAVGNPGVSSMQNHACGRTYVYEWSPEKPSVLFVRW